MAKRFGTWWTRFKSYKVTIARIFEAEIKDGKNHHRQIEEFMTGDKQPGGNGVGDAQVWRRLEDARCNRNLA